MLHPGRSASSNRRYSELVVHNSSYFPVPVFPPVGIISQMAEPDDMQLLREYVAGNSEDAFATLVQRHVNLVYSVALRQLGDAQHAQDVAQAVFVILARKAASLRRETILTGWLYQTARFTAAGFRRGERRRQCREQESFMQSALDQSRSDAAWEQLAPLLDDAMGRLGKLDRTLILLRFFEGKSSAEAAAALKLNEPAAKRRCTRAIEKLRNYFSRRGVDSTIAAIAETISTHSVQMAPAALAKTATALALAKGATASASTLTLIKGALKLMAWTKAKTAVVVGVTVITLTLGVGSISYFAKPHSQPALPTTQPALPTNNATSRENRDACINNLRLIDGAIIQWALENGKPNGTTPKASDLLPYLPNGKLPACPDGGRYTLHAVGSTRQETCSVPGHELP